MTASEKATTMFVVRQLSATSRSSASSSNWLAGSDKSGHWIIVVPI
jgi:hypothetical protein